MQHGCLASEDGRQVPRPQENPEILCLVLALPQRNSCRGPLLPTHREFDRWLVRQSRIRASLGNWSCGSGNFGCHEPHRWRKFCHLAIFGGATVVRKIPFEPLRLAPNLPEAAILLYGTRIPRL